MDIYIDTNLLSMFAQDRIDPIAAFAGSPYRLAMTPDLADEYRTTLNHERVSMSEKLVAKRLLESSEPRGIFGFAEGGKAYSGFGQGVLASESMASTVRSCTFKERGDRAPTNRTDVFLAALSFGAVVLTDDKGSHFKNVKKDGGHIYSWSQVLASEQSDDEVLRSIGRTVLAATGTLREIGKP